MQKDNSLETLYFARALFLPKRKIAGRFLSGRKKKINWIDRRLVGCALLRALFVITLILIAKHAARGIIPVCSVLFAMASKIDFYFWASCRAQLTCAWGLFYSKPILAALLMQPVPSQMRDQSGHGSANACRSG